MVIEKNKSLKDCNTFGLDVRAKEYAEFQGERDVAQVVELYKRFGHLTILAGGSNTVFSLSEVEGCVLRVANRGIETLKEDDEEIILRVAAGEVWREFVLWCCERGYSGLENLAAIYGCVGAAPVQNIGAYGAQVADNILWVEGFDMANGAPFKVNAEDCAFDYRFSRWKYANKNELITHVVFKLSKRFTPRLSYSAVAKAVESIDANTLTPLGMCELITQIRNSKLPDVKTLGNVGSFFKNPTVSQSTAERLKAENKNLVCFDAKDGVKLSAGYLIEHCGFKGKRFGNVGMHANQGLVLVNYGGASGKEILDFAQLVIETVERTYGVRLEIEAHVV